MLDVFLLENYVLLFISVALFVVKAWAFVDALSHRPDAFEAAGKMTKKAWLVILGIFLAAHMIFWGAGPISLLNIAGTIAALVYIVDARPALRSLSRR